MSDESRDQADDVEAFTELLIANQRRVYAYLLSLTHNESSASELMQEVSVVLWRKFQKFERGSNFGAWAVQVARLSFYEWRRKQTKLPIPFSDEELASLTEVAEELSKEFDKRENALKSCLEKLDSKDRRLLHLRYFLNEKVVSIAERIGVSRRAIYKALNRVHASLLNCIRNRIAVEE